MATDSSARVRAVRRRPADGTIARMPAATLAPPPPPPPPAPLASTRTIDTSAPDPDDLALAARHHDHQAASPLAPPLGDDVAGALRLALERCGGRFRGQF